MHFGFDKTVIGKALRNGVTWCVIELKEIQDVWSSRPGRYTKTMRALDCLGLLWYGYGSTLVEGRAKMVSGQMEDEERAWK